MPVPHKILLVDDEPYVTAVVSAKLKQRGDVVFVASDGSEAFEIALVEGPTLVVSDYQMPETDGFELAKMLKAEPRTSTIPIILLTARGHLLKPSELQATNIKMMLAKPFSTRELIAAIDEQIARGVSASEAA